MVQSTRSAVALLVLALLAIPLAPAAAEASVSPVRASIARALAEAGLAWSDLPAHAEVVEIDTRAGIHETRRVTVDEAIRLVEDDPLLAPRPQEPDTNAHAVVGGVLHTCQDLRRYCYFTELVHDASATHAETKAAYDGALAGQGLPKAVSPFPLSGGATLRVWGRYSAGSHVANDTLALEGVALQNGLPGEGSASGDRALYGAGVGTLRLVAIPWGPDLVISYGRLNMHGAFTFCRTETGDPCAAAASAES